MHRFEAHFRVLELEQTATLDEIKQAYKDLVMVWHPDRFAHNIRLRHKAEEKLKQFNQAYDCLKRWCTDPKQHTSAQTTSPDSKQRTPQPERKYRQPQGARASQSAASHAHVKTSDLYITFAHAAYILERYCFESLKDIDAAHHEYQSGPFALIICDEPLALTLSVPCHSLQNFDRILLSIPCKSTGHFCQTEAQQLLKLLHTKVG